MDKQHHLGLFEKPPPFHDSWKDDRLTILGKHWRDSLDNSYYSVSIYHGRLRVMYSSKNYGSKPLYITKAIEMLGRKENYYAFRDRHLCISANVRTKRDL